MGPGHSTAVAVGLRGVRKPSVRARSRLLGADRSFAACAAALVAFGAIPFVLLAGHGGVLTGATGIFPADQLDYLAWIRELSSHALGSNNFDLAPSSHVFADPLFALSGRLVWFGISPAWAYLLWLPVGAAALFAGYRAYVRRLLTSRGERAVALMLALFAVTPVAPVMGWLTGVSGAQRNQLALAVADSTPALQLWGYFPIGITLALMCASLLAVERGVDAGRRPIRTHIAVAAGAAGLAAWIHPWQGATLVLILAGVVATERTRRALVVCGVAGIATCLPLAYYALLPHLDAAWATGQAQNNLSFSGWVAPALLLPLGLPALAALRRRPRDLQQRILLLWPLAAVGLYWLNPPYSIHALESASLPLAVLAVRGWRRVRLPRAVAAAIVALATIPGLVFAGTLLHDAIAQHRGAYELRADDARALRMVARSQLGGGVLAPAPIASAVPELTGRRTWLGHPAWTPGLGLREHEASRFFGGRMSAAVARRFVHSVGARLAVAPCGSSPRLARLIGPRLVSSARAGCARVLTLRP